MTTRARTTAEVEAGARAIHAMDCTIWGDEMVGSWEAGDDKHIYRAEAEACLAAADAAAPANRVREIKTLEFPYTDADFADAAPAVGVTVDAAALRRAASVDFSIDLKPEQFDSPDEYWSVVTHIYYDRAERSIPLSDARTRRVITAYLDALLTAQPEPGTHDDAGQPAEGGVFIPKREDWKP